MCRQNASNIAVNAVNKFFLLYFRDLEVVFCNARVESKGVEWG